MTYERQELALPSARMRTALAEKPAPMTYEERHELANKEEIEHQELLLVYERMDNAYTKSLLAAGDGRNTPAELDRAIFWRSKEHTRNARYTA